MRPKQCTLILLHENGRVLLGKKKAGFGAGKYNGFGGKVEPGETLLTCALREMHEESGVTLLGEDCVHTGFIVFRFEGREGEELHVHIFTASKFQGEPVETEEMAPRWFPTGAVPFGDMWADDIHWFPFLLGGKRFRGEFDFKGHDCITSFTLAEVPPGGAVCPYVADAATAVLVPLGEKPQTSIDF